MHIIYVPSEENPADAPSRGKKRPFRSCATPVVAGWAPRRVELRHRVAINRPSPKVASAAEHQQAVAEHFDWVYAAYGDAA